MKAAPAILALITLLLAAVCSAAETADELVTRADEVRSPQLDYTVDVTVTSVRPGGDKKTASYEVLIKGRDKTVIKTLSPEADRGRTLLMLGRDLWAYLPDVSKPIRISLQQRLIGEVANGDIARANFSGDYTAKLLRTETVEGERRRVLELTAAADDVTYSKVLYWVAEDGSPRRAEFYAVSGRLLKTCTYEAYKTMAGRKRPSRLVLKDPLVSGQMSIIEYGRMEVKPLPDKYFTKDYMKRMRY